jgi:hypothetical protein
MRRFDSTGKRIARTAALVGVIVGSLGAAAVEAAPIGVPAATTGAGKTTLGGEVNILLDRDLTGTGGLEAESSQAYAKGTIGVDDRLDLVFRLGFGDFSIDPGGFDTDIGPAFGAGMKVTWANLPEANLKIGSVFQTLRIRADETNLRSSWTEYDAALGVSMDMTASRDPKKRPTEFALVPYAGFAWSGVDVEGGPVEDDSFGLFLGLGAKSRSNVTFGIELRLVDQTALALNVGMAF